MSNVLDENVVILKFDNSDFKKNTADSVKSIENLKSSLRNADSGETLSKIGKAAQTIDLSGLGRSIDTINKRFSLFGIAGMSAINKLTTSAMGSVARVVKAVPNQMIQGGWRRALNIEQAEFLMEGLGHKFEGTYDKVTKEFTGIKGAVQAAVDGTRYGLDEAAKIASQLMASGITDADELASRLKSISGIASVTNSDFFDMGRIFSQVAGAGRMMGDDLLQISERGINAAAKISEYLNANDKVKKQALDNAIAQGKQVKKMEEISKHAKLTEADVREMVSAGAISFDIMASSFEDFFEQAQKANNTYEGSFANVKAALSRMGEQLEAPKLQNMTRIFNTLLPILKQFENFITPFTSKIAKASNKVTDFINEGILNPIGEAIGVDPANLFHGLASEVKKAGDESEKAGQKTKSLGDKVAVTAKEWRAAMDIWNKGTYGTGQKRADAIRELGMSYEHVQGIINKFYKNNYDWAKTKKQFDIENENKKKQNKKDAKETAEETDRLHEQTEQLSTLGKVIRGVINLIKSFNNILSGLKNIVTAIWRSIKGIVATASGGLMSVFLKITEVILDISQKFLKLTELLKKGGLEALGEKAPNIAKALGLIKTAISAVFKVIKTAAGTVKDFFTTLSNYSALGQFRSAIGKLVSAGFNRLQSIIDKIRQNVSSLTKDFSGPASLGQTVASVFGSIIEQISKFISSLVTGKAEAGSFFSTIGAAANSILGFFSPVVDFLIDKFFGAIKTTFEFFQKLGKSEGIANLKNSLLDLGSALFKAVEPMGSVVYGMEKISSASNGGGNLDKAVNFFSNIAQGLSDFINAVARGESPLQKFIDVFKKVKSALSLDGVIEYLQQTIGAKVGSGLASAFTGLINTFESVKKWLTSLGLLDKAVHAANVVLGGIDTIVQWVKGIDFGKIFNKIVNAPWEKMTKVGLGLAGIISMIKMTRDMGMVAKSATGMFKSIGGMFSSFGSIAETIKTSIKMKSFETLALSVAILIGAIVALAMVPADQIKPAIAVVIGIMGALTGIMLAMSSSKFDAAKLQAIGVAFAGVGVGIALIATSMLMIARLSVDEIIKAGSVIAAFMIIIALISKRAAAMAGTGTAFLGLAIALNLLVTAVLAFAMMPFAVLIRGGGALVAFMIAISLAARIAKSSNPGGFVAMAIGLNLLVPAILMMSLIPPDKLIRGGGAVVALMMALAVAARIAGGKGFGEIGKMALVMGVLAAACIVFSLIKPERLIPAAASISTMMLTLGKAASAAQKNSKAILSMALLIGVLAGSIIALDQIAPERAVKIALSLSAVFVALGIAMGAFGKLGGGIKAAAAAGAGMSVMLLEIVGMVTLIVAAFSGIRKAIDSIFGEGSGAEFMSYMSDTLGLLGEAIGKFMGGFVSGFSNWSGVSNSIDQLIDFVNGVSSLATAASSFNKGQLSKLTEFANDINTLASADLKSAIAKFLGGGTMDISAQIDSFTTSLHTLIKGIADLTPDDIGKAKLAADIFGVFAHGAHEMPMQGGLGVFGSYKTLKGFAEQMVDFGNLMPDFISAMDQVPLEKLKAFMQVGEDGKFAKDSKLGLLMTMLSAFTHADIPETSIKAEVWDGFKSLSSFGEEMSGFGESMVNFISEMDQVPLNKLQAFMQIGKNGSIGENSKLSLILNLISALNKLQGKLNPSGGVQQGIHGNTTLGEFARDLAGFNGFGANLRTFVSQMGDEAFTIDQLQAVQQKIGPIADIVTTLSKAGAEIPPSGGIEQFVTGTQDIGNYGAQLAQFAIGFKTLYDNFNLITIDDPKAFQTKVDAIATASKSLNAIKPPSTGFFDALSTWAQMKLSTRGISSMISCIRKVGSSKIPDNIADKASDVATASDALKDIKPPSDSFVEAIKKWVTAKIDSAGIDALVDTLNKVSSKGYDIDTTGIAKFATAVSSVKTSVGAIKSLKGIPTGANLVTLAQNMYRFSVIMSKTDTSGVSDKASEVAASAKSMGKSASAAAASLKGKSSSFASAGASLTSSLAKGLGKTSSVSSAARKLVNAAKNAINTNALHGVGAQLSAGLAAGMRSALGKIKSAADEMERQAERAVKAKSKISSPSRVFMRLGAYIGEGFAIGISSFNEKVYRASGKMAQMSVNAANDALESLNTFDSPVITPVLDLTQVEQGANNINSLLSANEAIAVSANMNSVPSNYATASIVGELLDKFDTMTAKSLKVSSVDGNLGATITNNITVDGSENPEEFANRFVNQLKVQMRTS